MKKIRVSELFFYIGYALLLFEAMFNNLNSLNIIFSIIDKAFVVLAIFIIFMQNEKYNIKRFILMCIVCVVLCINYFITKDNALIKIFFLVVAFKDLNFNKFIKVDLIIRGLCFTFVIILYKLQIIENIIIYRADGTIRQSLGFSHPNALGAYIMSISFSYIYIRYKNIKLRDVILLFLALIFATIYTDSRTATAGILLLFIFIALNKLVKNKKNRRIVKKCIPLIPVFCAILSVLCTLLYNKYEFISDLDSILSKRIMYSNYFWKEYGVSMFGQDITTVSTVEAALYNLTPKILDNTYILVLIKYGIINFIIFNVLSFKSLKYLLKENNKTSQMLVIILVVYYICGMLESWLIKFSYNIFILYFAIYLYNKKIGDK